MATTDHNKFLAIGFALFAAIFGMTFLLLMLVSLGVFIGLGITLANESGDNNQAGIGVLGGLFAVLFYGVLGAIFVLPTSLASFKMWKHRRNARIWGILAAIAILATLPLGTILGVYGLWFFFSAEGKQYYSTIDSEIRQALATATAR